jgi:hypothetical protein
MTPPGWYLSRRPPAARATQYHGLVETWIAKNHPNYTAWPRHGQQAQPAANGISRARHRDEYGRAVPAPKHILTVCLQSGRAALIIRDEVARSRTLA